MSWSSFKDELGIIIKHTRGEYVDALCPFHEEKHPSFSINTKTGYFICRHEDLKGSLADLVSFIKGFSLPEAKEWLQNNYREREVMVSDITAKLLTRPLENGILQKWLERYYSLPVDKMSSYFFERGFTVDTMGQFGVRYDEEANSILFPVRDERKTIISFVERKIPPCEVRFMYPQGFQKVLFPMERFEGDRVILVEGPLDAMWLHQHNIKEGLCLFGASLSNRQLKWLQKKTTEVILALDNDMEGWVATDTIRRKLNGLTVRKIQLPRERKDIQEVEGQYLHNLIAESKLMLF